MTLEVCSVVNSILAAFQNGMSVMVRMDGRGHKKHRKPPRMNHDELELHDSLLNRPKEIKNEYSQSVVKHGRKFEQGDNKAYTSLAHTLFVLNSGLLNLINNALTSETMDKSRSRQSLLLLSESAAISTIQALNQLDARLSLPAETSSEGRRTRREQRSVKQTSDSATISRPSPSPLLPRGGWVRSKSGSSVVTIASAKKSAARNSDHQRSRSLPVRTMRSTSKDPPELPTKPPAYNPKECSSLHHHQFPSPEQQSTDIKSWWEPSEYDERAPSMLLVPADYFNGQDALAAQVLPPPRPPKTPLHARYDIGMRPRPISAATFMTASTKIGEIPEYKQADRIISEEELQEKPLPYVIPAPLESPKRKTRGMRFWKRNEREAAMAA